ncbi:hypothetical protein [Breoghania sp. L-A4]|uniref:hypothetical protein n=1 Tax=Breoghania sp. L-A4 TaxID=2304600 RepID=UPI0013C33EA5|nr:hypothetical protein [Breoghania sp. L-A4]
MDDFMRLGRLPNSDRFAEWAGVPSTFTPTRHVSDKRRQAFPAPCAKCAPHLGAKGNQFKNLNGGSGARRRIRTTDTRIFNQNTIDTGQGFAASAGVKPGTKNQALSDGLANPFSEEIRDCAHLIRRIGNGRHATPETILEDKHEAADRLLLIADRMELAR